MPHADTSLVPSSIKTKQEFWEHVSGQLGLLFDGQRNWVSNLANASSLIYNSLLAFPSHFGRNGGAVNWCGFYIDSGFFPSRKFNQGDPKPHHADSRLLLGPFCGKPACQFINTTPGKARGVCADAFLQRTTIVVPEVDLYPGHIACDGETKSEIVCPLILRNGGTDTLIGVLDLDCLAISAFNEEDKIALEKIADLVVRSSDW
jgi:L-methionine (R)-S-oxide reductase